MDALVDSQRAQKIRQAGTALTQAILRGSPALAQTWKPLVQQRELEARLQCPERTLPSAGPCAADICAGEARDHQAAPHLQALGGLSSDTQTAALPAWRQAEVDSDMETFVSGLMHQAADLSLPDEPCTTSSTAKRVQVQSPGTDGRQAGGSLPDAGQTMLGAPSEARGAESSPQVPSAEVASQPVAPESQPPGSATRPSTATVRAVLTKEKPAWSLTQDQAAELAEAEEANLLDFADTLDFDDYVAGLDDVELADAMKVRSRKRLRQRPKLSACCQQTQLSETRGFSGGYRVRVYCQGQCTGTHQAHWHAPSALAYTKRSDREWTPCGDARCRALRTALHRALRGSRCSCTVFVGTRVCADG